MTTFEARTRFTTDPNCILCMNRYANNGHVALSIFSLTDGPFANLTVNLPEADGFPKNFSFVDTNNFPEGEDLIYELGIGKVTNFRTSSGFCVYPLYEFDEKAIRKYIGKTWKDVIK